MAQEIRKMFVTFVKVGSRKYLKNLAIELGFLVKGVAAAVCEVNEKQRTIDVFKITHFSAYHNFEFGSGGIRAQKAYVLCERRHESQLQRHYLPP